jgi:hypothetical protein
MDIHGVNGSWRMELHSIHVIYWFLGMRVIRDRKKRTITLVHDTYIDKITAKFGLQDESFPPTPLPSEDLVKVHW